MKTKILFKKFHSNTRVPNEIEVIALFPEEYTNWEKTLISSYMHIGQHSGASPELIDELEEATKEEYRELLEELEHVIGYGDLEILNADR